MKVEKWAKNGQMVQNCYPLSPLGSLKNEADDHLKDCGWAKDDTNRLREEEDVMLHFDALILGGCKFYCLWKKGCEN